MSCTQAGVPELTEDVLRGHSPQRLPQGIVEFGLRPRPGPAEPLLDLREHLLDRGVVRACNPMVNRCSTGHSAPALAGGSSA